MSLTSFPISYKFKPPYASINQTTTTPNQTKPGVIIIRAGLAGLAAATHLQSNSIPFLLLESSDSIGGRVRTDYINGYTLDRGFQIFITAYPEANKLLDYNALHLQRFYSGAKVFYNGKFHTVADPLRHFTDALMSFDEGSKNKDRVVYVTSATFDGALVSGRRAVEALLKDRAKAKV